jgi:hypothetical protein
VKRLKFLNVCLHFCVEMFLVGVDVDTRVFDVVEFTRLGLKFLSVSVVLAGKLGAPAVN